VGELGDVCGADRARREVFALRRRGDGLTQRDEGELFGVKV
jgi:hypothetical protein